MSLYKFPLLRCYKQLYDARQQPESKMQSELQRVITISDQSDGSNGSQC